jgi:molybdate transport system permease protein
MVLAFAKALKEFGATIIDGANILGQTQTLPSAIYAFLLLPGGDSSAVWAFTPVYFISDFAPKLSEWMVSVRYAGYRPMTLF